MLSTFDFVVVGSGGGPFETNLSAYFLKPHHTSWTDGIIALEAGSGIGTLGEQLRRNPALFDDTPKDGPTSAKSKLSAYELYSHIKCFLISHGHLDHVNGLVLSAGALQELKGSDHRRHIFAARSTLEDLATIFSDRAWPNLASWDPDDDAYKLLYDPLQADGHYRTIFPEVSARMMPIPHGRNGTVGNYESSAFFIRCDRTQNQFLFFGDVEPSSVSHSSQTEDIWRVAAPMIPEKLSAIFIECSWPSGRQDAHLYGHLSPKHLVAELTLLATEVVLSRRQYTARFAQPRLKKRRRITPSALRGALAGVRIYIIHCKDDLENAYDRPINHVIRDQVKELIDKEGLGAEILSAEQGTRITI